jgi:hypothetical protein
MDHTSRHPSWKFLASPVSIENLLCTNRNAKDIPSTFHAALVLCLLHTPAITINKSGEISIQMFQKTNKLLPSLQSLQFLV